MSLKTIRKERCVLCNKGIDGYLTIDGHIRHFAEPLFSQKDETTPCTAPSSDEYIEELEALNAKSS